MDDIAGVTFNLVRARDLPSSDMTVDVNQHVALRARAASSLRWSRRSAAR
jgi:hypothetical protein